LELQSANQELVDINKALSVLARNLDKTRQETEITIARTINSKIMPIVEDLRKANNLDSLQSGLGILAAQVQTLTDDLMNGGVNVMDSLTPTEMRYATMIKNGLTSKDIAKKLYISLHTAKTHRRNIRKKLNVRNSSINLTSYLRSIM
jgi:DNA-binding CsgD family transcriptional regulator